MSGDQNTPDPGKTVNTPDQGKKVETPDFTKLVNDAVGAALAPLIGNLEKLGTTVNSLAAERRRETETQKKVDSPKSKDPEIIALQEEVQNERNARLQDRKRLALKDALDSYGDQIVGRKHLEKLIAPDLDVNSDGIVVAKVDGKHVPLADYVKTYAEDPQFKSSTGRDGTGRSTDTNPKSQKKIQISRNDMAAKQRHMEAIAKGDVEFID